MATGVGDDGVRRARARAWQLPRASMRLTSYEPWAARAARTRVTP